MSKNIVFEGWLTKSPPSKRIWRTKWRRRWFALRQSGELPGQYFLDYYADRNCRRLKGTINLDLCEQVDAGLHMDRTGSSLDPKLRGSVFTIQTQSRTYHLEADCQAEMEQWVDAICRVCGLRATDETPEEIGTCPSNINPITSQPCSIAPETTGPYIPISECITGVRAQDSQRAFTFDHKNIVTSTRSTLERMADQKDNHLYTSQPQMRSPNNEFSENESNLSEEECKSLTSSQSNIKDIEVAKSFTKLTVSPEKNGESEEGPPVPPRPPKTFAMSKEMFASDQDSSMRRAPRRISQAAPPSAITRRLSVGEDEESHNQSLQYCNIAMPPAVDRALKPRSSIYTIGSISTVPGTHYVRNSSGAVIFRKNPQQGGIEASYIKFARPPIVPPVSKPEEVRSDTLQYLDLDLPPLSESSEASRKLQEIRRRDQGKSFSGGDSDCAYKTVDFLKTEAFNITRQDAEASRSNY